MAMFVVCLAVNWIFSVFPLAGFFRSSEYSQGLKVLSFNCNLHYKESDYFSNISHVRQLLFSTDADVVFLTENYFHDYDTLWRSIREIYPYCICDSSTSGNCIYSRYSMRGVCASNDTPNCITQAVVSYLNVDIKIIGCHLSSNNYDENEEYHTPERLEGFMDLISYISTVGYASEKRVKQARNVCTMIQTSMPTIVLGDMNDVCGSPCMSEMAACGLKDGWWEHGIGYGATIHNPIPFRIDHIMHNKKIRLLNIEKIDCSGISDHDALVALFKI